MDWLERLRAEGELESTGYFSMDFERAQQMLARFTLQYPRQYLQHLVVAAVLSRATRWTLKKAHSGFHIAFDGSPATPEELHSLLDGLVLDHFPLNRRWLRWLALGALGASREAVDVWVETSLGARMWLGPKSCEAVAPSRHPAGSTSLEVRYRRTVWSRIFGLADLERPALACCRFAPLAIRLDGHDLSERIPMEGRLTTLVQGIAALPTLALLDPDRVTHRTTNESYSVALCFPSMAQLKKGWSTDRELLRSNGHWLSVAGILSELPSTSIMTRAVIAFDELASDLGGLQIQQDERRQATAILAREIERSLADAAARGEREAWDVIAANWAVLSTEGELMQRPLLPDSTGRLVPLARLRRGRALVAADYPEPLFQGQPVFHPDTLRPLASRIKVVPLCRKAHYGWVQGDFRAKKGRWGESLRLPGRYLRQSHFDYLGVAGRCGLTREPTPPMPVLCYSRAPEPRPLGAEATTWLTARPQDEPPADGPIEVTPDCPLPGGLHVVTGSPIAPSWEFAPALVPLYLALLNSPARAEEKLYHVLEFLGYVARRFQQLRGKGGEHLLVPYQVLQENQQVWAVRFELQYAVQEFANAPFLPGGLRPARAHEYWDSLTRRLKEPQLKHLVAFLGEPRSS